MKIAHFVCAFPPYQGGMGNSASQFASYTALLNHRVEVFTPLYSTELPLADSGPVTVKRLKPLLSYGNAALMPVWRISLNDYDIVHLHYPFFGTSLLLALRKRLGGKFKLIIHYHMDSVSTGWKGLVFRLHHKLLASWILNSAEAITCASLDYVKHSWLAKYFLANQHKFIQVPFGVDIKLFHPAKEKQDRLVFVGGLDRAHYFKGINVLLSAFATLGERFKEYRLAIIGRGDLLDDYRRLAEQLKVAERVDFISDADDAKLAEICRHSKALILPSVNMSEAFGLVLLEGMASGLPVIASNLPGVRSVFKNGEQGFLFKPGNVDDLAQRIWQVVVSDKRYLSMSQSARRLVEERYTWERAAEILNGLYSKLKYSPNFKNNQYEDLPNQ